MALVLSRGKTISKSNLKKAEDEKKAAEDNV